MPRPIDANVLNAGQLVEILNRMPPDATVVIPGYEQGLDNVIREHVAMTTIRTQHERAWPAGEYSQSKHPLGQLAVVLGVHARERDIPPPTHTFMWINPNLADQNTPKLLVKFQHVPQIVNAGFVLRLNLDDLVLETYHPWGTSDYLRFPPLRLQPTNEETFLDEVDQAEFLVVEREQNYTQLVHLPL